MNIDWPAFTPWASLVGGALIGLGSVLLLTAVGKIAGISGIFGSLVAGEQQKDGSWRVLFLVGLIATPSILQSFAGISFATAAKAPGSVLAWTSVVIGGLLVGFGTRLANGCTSGHGICGLSRLSRRSLLAVPVFMSSAMGTVYVTRHLLGA